MESISPLRLATTALWAATSLLAGTSLGQVPNDAAPIVLPPVDGAASDDAGGYSVSWLAQNDSGADEAGADVVEGDDESLAERIAALEEQYGSLEEAQGGLEDALAGYVRSGHSGSVMKVGGRVHVDMWNFPESTPGINAFETGNPAISPQDRIGFRRLRFGVAGDLPYNMLYKIEMEFAGGNDVEFRDAYLGWNELPMLRTVLVGNQKRPYGLDHLNSSRYNVFLERPFIIEGFNQDARRLGICSYGFSADEAWNWRYGVFNQRNIQDEGNYTSDHYQGQIAGRLANTIWYDQCSDGRGYAHWAIAGTWADTDGNADTNNYAGSGQNEADFRTRPEARSVNRWLDTDDIDGADDYSLLALESVINVGPVQVVGEYQNVWLDRAAAPELFFHGGYVYVAYFLTGEHMPWDRESGTLDRPVPFENFFLVSRRGGATGRGLGAWQIAARWSYGDFADGDVQGGIGESVTAGLNWYWTPYARMQLNYIYGDITHNDLNAAGGSPNFGHYQIIGTRLMVDF